MSPNPPTLIQAPVLSPYVKLIGSETLPMQTHKFFLLSKLICSSIGGTVMYFLLNIIFIFSGITSNLSSFVIGAESGAGFFA